MNYKESVIGIGFANLGSIPSGGDLRGHAFSATADMRQELGWKLGRYVLLAIVVAGSLTLAACGGSSTATITSVSITPTSASVPLNTSSDFTATVNLNNGTTSTTTTVTWQVNGTNGGSSTVGTIVSSASDNEVGVYTAPAIVPTTNNGQVNITAIATQTTTGSTTTTTITSNTAVVTVSPGLGLAVVPTSATVPAGGTFQFSATLNSVADTNVAWTVSSADGGIIGSIDPTTGLYTAPNSPPPGGVVTITATDPTVTTPVTATAKIVYSDISLKGPYAFSYTGNDQTGFFSVVGSFVADGSGHILSGIQDVTGFGIGLSSSSIPIAGGTYQVGADGRGSAIVNTTGGNQTWRFALTTDQHAAMIRFDKNFTGSGTIEQQNLGDLSVSPSLLSGPYVFRLFGADLNFHPMGIAGKFAADGGGSIPESNTILDLNDDGSISPSDRTLQGSYAFDANNPGTGRGTLTISSNTTKQLGFAFYIIDSTRLRLVENDGNAYLAGELLSAPTGSSFSAASLASGNFAFTTGGMSSAGAYAAGGVFTSDGGGNISGGVLDTNNAGTTALNASLSSCPYTVDATTGRIDLRICPSGTATASEFAAYQAQTSLGTAVVMLETDPNAISSGAAYPQTTTQAPSTGSYALSLAGQGVFYNAPSSYQQCLIGQFPISSVSIASGNLDINNYNATFPSDPLSSTGGSFGSPGSAGRGTFVLSATDPAVTYNLIYYIVDTGTALLFDQDKTFILTGKTSQQF